LKNTFELAVCFKGSCAIPLHQDFKWRLLAPPRILKSDLAAEFSRLAMVLARIKPHPTFTSGDRPSISYWRVMEENSVQRPAFEKHL